MNSKLLNKRSFRRYEIRAQIFRVIRHIPLIGENIRKKKYGAKPILGVEEGREILKAAVIKGDPFMAARFGTSEGLALVNYWKIKLFYGEKFEKLSDKELEYMYNNAGFFPKSKKSVWKWAEMETEACKQLDLLGVMQFVNEEWIYETFCNKASLMQSSGLSSASKGWAHVLEGKKVLVVHPFTDTIERQYNNNREKIFPGTNALPRFELKCVKAVQTIADQEDNRFETWFDALDYMTEEIKKQDFDICLIGCGAYGFQLASRVKQMGKIAIHMGGSLQTLFGIKGSRWDKKYNSMYNEYWVSPSQEETPKGFEKVEGGCYWSK